MLKLVLLRFYKACFPRLVWRFIFAIIRVSCMEIAGEKRGNYNYFNVLSVASGVCKRCRLFKEG